VLCVLDCTQSTSISTQRDSLLPWGDFIRVANSMLGASHDFDGAKPRKSISEVHSAFLLAFAVSL
jgi:hypothetical protein